MNPYKMAIPQEKAQRVSWFTETMLDTQTQRNYRIKYERDSPSCPSVRAWNKKFMETGILLYKGRIGRPRKSEENIDPVKQAFSRSATKSILTAAI